MAGRVEKQLFVTEEALEVRYEPRGSFLAHVGEIADYVRDRELFPHWEIQTNTINFRDAAGEPDHLRAVMSYKNAGLIATDPPTRNFFSDKACKYWKTVESNPYFKIPALRRIGVRNRCFVRIDREFAAIEKSMFDYLCKPDAMRILGGIRRDHQVVFNLEDGDTKLTSSFAPLQKGEAKRLFGWTSEHFEFGGLFIDLDCAIDKPLSGSKSVEEFIKSSSSASWERIETLLSAMGL